MPVLSALDPAAGGVLSAETCVIGSGPAGMTIASALAGSRPRVMVVESGGSEPDPEVQALNRIENAGLPVRRDAVSRLRLVGGTSNVWPGRCMALQPIDLEARSWVPGSGWPIEFGELARYYVPAARLLGLPGVPGCSGGATGLGVPGAGEARLLAGGGLETDAALWGRSPMRFGKVFRRLFSGPDGPTLVTDLTVTGIGLDGAGGRVQAMRAATMDGRRLTLRAGTYVLACGGLENARLLLASLGRGAGNRHDQVGRCFMDHPRAVAGRIELHRRRDLGRLLGVPLAGGRIKTGLVLPPAVQRAEGLVNCLVELEPAYVPDPGRLYGTPVEVVRRVHRGRFGQRPGDRVDWTEACRHLSRQALRGVIPHRLYHTLHYLRKRRASELVAVVHCEQAPNPASRVSLAAERDRFGLPMARLDWRIGDQERRSADRLLDALDAQLRRQGLGRLQGRVAEPDLGDAAHHMGTTRMNADPRGGVVDADCRVHGIANLYVAGGSVFPTGGHANPTLTVVALALRLAHHLGHADPRRA